MSERTELQERLKLDKGAEVAILGGGPAGSFFAIHILREAKKAKLDITVTIIDKRMRSEPDGTTGELRGCNFCAGIISPRLQKELTREGISPPNEVICEKFTHIWIHGLWKNFPLRVPLGQELISLFRGEFPSGRSASSRGFDQFLLGKAVEEGAKIISGEALELHYTSKRRPSVTIKSASGDRLCIEADFVCISTGVNPDHGKGYEENTLLSSYKIINPKFMPPERRAALIFELRPGTTYLKKYMARELYIIISGADRVNLDHAALIPKGEYLTVALIGKTIDKASSPEDREDTVRTFLSLPHIQNILPEITPENTPVMCRCSPDMAVTPCREPFAERIAMAGDAFGARLYRDGLFSAFVTSKALAQTVIHRGVDRKSLSDGCGWVEEWLREDNRYGKLLLGLMQALLKSPLLSRVLYQTFATEMKFKQKERWPLGALLWKIGSGAADYKEMCRDLVSAPVLLSILRGILKTVRNILTELLFGLNWEAYGRYPTVIIKEKRNYFKESISAPFGIKLDPSPEMERMYAIKIRASAGKIFEELGKFGEPEGKLLRLRFVDVRRVSGLPNQKGAVVRYSLKRLPISMDITLIRTIQGKALLYEPAQLFAEHGKLLFDISPTKDGNSRLVIYTAFDFKKGKKWHGKVFWKLFKTLFPEYAHDVVWNHAICSIKGEAERSSQAFSGLGDNLLDIHR